MTALENKTILVTGGAGFIGSHLCEKLVGRDNTVISLDNYFAGSKDNHIDGVIYIEGHTKDIGKLILLKPDIVFHLGEYSRVEKSFDEPEIVFDFNSNGTFAVIEFCLNNDCKLVYAGSSTKFEDGCIGKNQSPYAFTKATNTELIKNYSKWFGLRYAITYFYNVYGGRERSSGDYSTLVAIYKNKYLKGEKLGVVLPGTQLRNFTHIEDTVDGIIIAGESGENDEYGIGAAESYSIIETAQMFGEDIELLPERKGNRNSAVIHSVEITKLGWTQKHKFSDHIKEFIDLAGTKKIHE